MDAVKGKVARGIDVFTVQGRILEYLLSTRRWKLPDQNQAFTFLVSEVGEVADAMTRRADFGDFPRHAYRSPDVALELADVVTMACVTAAAMGIDLDAALTAKLKILRERFNSE